MVICLSSFVEMHFLYVVAYTYSCCFVLFSDDGYSHLLSLIKMTTQITIPHVVTLILNFLVLGSNTGLLCNWSVVLHFTALWSSSILVCLPNFVYFVSEYC